MFVIKMVRRRIELLRRGENGYEICSAYDENKRDVLWFLEPKESCMQKIMALTQEMRK